MSSRTSLADQAKRQISLADQAKRQMSPLAGTAATPAILVDIAALQAAYFDLQPDVSVAAQRVAFGTSGHRGCSFERSFNQWHVWAMVQSICDYRKSHGINGPLHLGFDTHALSLPAFESALEVLAANAVTTRVAPPMQYTPTPAISHAILRYNSLRNANDCATGLSDGIVITPSHNPPDAGGLKYNTPNGGPADTVVTEWIQTRANILLTGRMYEVNKLTFALANSSDTTHIFDYLAAYVDDLANVLDMAAIRHSQVRIGVDPMGGAGVDYWARIAAQYRLNLTVIDAQIDPQFAFMSLDWDGKIRMDPSSAYAMQRVIAMKDQFDVCLACDTDHDRHGIVTPGAGLLSANHYLSVAVDYLFRHRPRWLAAARIGKTVVNSAMMDRIAFGLGRSVYEVPVGFKYFADGLLHSTLAFAGEESAGASFSRIDGGVWTTDKDGIAAALLAAEITATTGLDPGVAYAELANKYGAVFTDRLEAYANFAQKAALAKLAPKNVVNDTLAGDAITQVLDRAPGNGAAIGGIKVQSVGGWFAARPSGTEDIYKIYAESFRSAEHLQAIFLDAQKIVDAALKSSEPQSEAR